MGNPTLNNLRKARAFSTNAAVCFEEVISKGGFKTVNIDIAVRKSNEKNFNWGEKMTVQLSKQELPEISAVFLGLKKSCSFKRDNCGIGVENQGNVFFISASRQKRIGIPVSKGDAHWIAVLLIQLLSELTNVEVTIAALRGVFQEQKG